MLKFRIDQRIKGTTSPKQMQQLLESKLEKLKQTFQVGSAKFQMVWTSDASRGRKCRNSGRKQISDSPKRAKKRVVNVLKSIGVTGSGCCLRMPIHDNVPLTP